MKNQIITLLIIFNGIYAFAEIDSLPKGLDLNISKRYPLEKVSTNLTMALDMAKDFKALKLKSYQGDSSLKYEIKKFCLGAQTLLFKEIDYTVRCSWSLKNDSCRVEFDIIEITFDKINLLERAFYNLNKHMPKHEEYMIGYGNYEWFKYKNKIYFLQFREIESDPDVVHDCSDVLYDFAKKFKQKLIEK
jgi:hypothetical protein